MKALLIGGPSDGMRTNVSDRVNRIVTAKLSPCEFADRPPSNPGIDEHEYYFVGTMGDTLIYRHSGFPGDIGQRFVDMYPARKEGL